MSRQKISKPLLQQSLRPVLNSLSHYNKLKLHMLQGLARLLTLLHGWFNAALGKFIYDSTLSAHALNLRYASALHVATSRASIQEVESSRHREIFQCNACLYDGIRLTYTSRKLRAEVQEVLLQKGIEV